MRVHVSLYVMILSCSFTSVKGQYFSYPHIPDNVIEKYDRIAYMGKKFFEADSIDNIDARVISDFIYILSLLKEEDISICMDNFIRKCQYNENVLGKSLYWFDDILYNSNSPQYDEKLYSHVITILLESNVDESHKILPTIRKEIISKNRVGYAANNFSFIDKMGRERNLYSIDATMLLLEFNNPDCSLCHQAEEYIGESEMLQAMLNSGWLVVLSVTPDADYEDWMEHNYPANWLVGYDKEKIIYNQQLYDIQRLPCFYLLDKDKRVLLKEADIKRVLEFLGNIP